MSNDVNEKSEKMLRTVRRKVGAANMNGPAAFNALADEIYSRKSNANAAADDDDDEDEFD